MKKNFVLGATLAFTLLGGVLFTNTTVNAAPIIANTSQAEQLATDTNDFTAPNISVSLIYEQNNQIPTNAMPMEEATQIGARYIWDVLGEDLEGKNVFMSYQAQPSSTRTHWVGMVSNDGIRESSFEFTIDAISGERISIIRLHCSDEGAVPRTATREQINERLQTTPANIEHYTQFAWQFAGLHFHATDVESVVFNNLSVGAFRNNNTRSQEDFDANIITYTETLLHFTAIDENGRNAMLSISMETGKLISLHTQRNDFVPGQMLPETHQRDFISQGDVAPVEPRQEPATQGNWQNENGGSSFAAEGWQEWANRVGLSGLTWAEIEEIMNNPNHPRHIEVFGSLTNRP